jgi:hypothetical protein
VLQFLAQRIDRVAFRANWVLAAGPRFSVFVVENLMDGASAMLENHSILPSNQGYAS